MSASWRDVHSGMKAACIALASILVLAGPLARAEGVGREDALKALLKADAPARRDAAGRLGEIGTATDAPALVHALRDDDEDVRARAEQALWLIWARSGDPEVDRLYQTGVAQMSAGELRPAIDTFTRIIEMKPDFAEGWNKRATLYFFAGDLRKSLADCDEVMKRNPYHFGALAGYVQIHTRLENYERALEYAHRALNINPNMEGIIRTVDVLEHLLEQRRRQMI